MAGSVPVPGYSNLRYTGGASKPAEQHISPALLAALNDVGRVLGKTIDIFSGSGGPSVRGAGFTGDPHSKGVAVDATIDGMPIGSYPGAVIALHGHGLRTGATDFTYQGKSDPAHVDTLTRPASPAPVTSATFKQFFTETLNALRIPVTASNLRFLTAWAKQEGTSAANNPLATTQQAPGATPFNSVGVRNYPYASVGASATAQTLKGYPAILAALRSGNASSQVDTPAVRADLNKWATGTPSPAATSYTSGIAANAKSGGGLSLGDLIPSNPLGPGNIFGFGGGPATNLVNDVKAPFDATLAVSKFLGRLTQPSYILRGLQIIAGAVLVLVGVVLLTRQVALAADLPDPIQLAASKTPIPPVE